ncbi:LysR family transcriptional regulator [Seohaeicola saemankumensis]|nr:LysR family transcriptional regulator [Seohaeicola saemankumensis]MCA0873715.1 LysR family transcriptional regulator [Seohaeicola saemankumensis]
MNWTAINFDWNQARAFLVTAEEGSLSAAARALGLTQPTLGRQVAGLEEALGVTLFERVGRGIMLTQAGVELLDHVRGMGDAAGRISLAASGQSQSVEGAVSITASDLMSAYHLPPVIARLREIAPGIEVTVVAANDVRDLTRREADVAIRHVRPEQPELIAKLIGHGDAGFYAARRYVSRVGRPDTLADLTGLDFVGFARDDQLIARLGEMGLPLRPENFRLFAENGMVYWNLIAEGLGVGILPDDLAGPDPRLTRLIPDMEPIRFPLWLTTHRELHTSRRIRVVFDLLAEMLGDRADRRVSRA